MPLAAEESLREAVALELDRFTPMPAEQAWFDHRVTGRDANAQRLRLQLAVAASAPVEAKLAELRELGATILGVGVEDDVAGVSTPFNLLPADKRDRPAVSRSTLAVRFLAVAAALLALAALVVPLWLKRDAAIALYPRLESARAGAEVAERLAREIERRHGLSADSWMELNQQLLVGLRSQSASSWMIQVLVVLAVALGIASVLGVSVIQKSREIGILKATGTTTRTVQRIFLLEGAIVGAAGSVLGAVIGSAMGIAFANLAKGPGGAPLFPVDLTPGLYLGASAVAIVT
ncbi:MAG: hypothetical protein C3F16_07945, partial [Betaproteobacteria bacterium]